MSRRRLRDEPGKCQRVAARPGHGACVAYRRAGALTRQIATGHGKLELGGRLRGRRMKPGTYRLTLVATDAAANRSAPVRLNLTVAR